MELSNQENAVPSTTLGRLGYKSVVRILPHVLFKFNHLIREEERCGSECEVIGKKALKTTEDNAKDVLSRKMLAKVVKKASRYYIH